MIKKDKTDEIDRDEKVENRDEDESDDENERAQREKYKDLRKQFFETSRSNDQF